MEISARLAVTLATGKWLCPDRDEFWEACNFITQSDMTNMTLYSRGAKFAASCIQEQYPELSLIDYSSVKDEATCKKFILELEDQYGKQVKIQPSDRPFLELDPVDEWANVKGISREEAEQAFIII